MSKAQQAYNRQDFSLQSVKKNLQFIGRQMSNWTMYDKINT